MALHMRFGQSAGSIVLPRQGKAAAVIDGQLVTLGGMVGDARLTRISETGIVLEGPGDREALPDAGCGETRESNEGWQSGEGHAAPAKGQTMMKRPNDRSLLLLLAVTLALAPARRRCESRVLPSTGSPGNEGCGQLRKTGGVRRDQSGDDAAARPGGCAARPAPSIASISP